MLKQGEVYEKIRGDFKVTGLGDGADCFQYKVYKIDPVLKDWKMVAYGSGFVMKGGCIALITQAKGRIHKFPKKCLEEITGTESIYKNIDLV